LPTCWFVPETRTPGALPLFKTFTRFGPLAKAETERANSIVAPLETTAASLRPVVRSHYNSSMNDITLDRPRNSL
jgi:hypothetical protein